jgi:POT family proton-dependent oligopeptide transporter
MNHAIRKGRVALLLMQTFSTLGFSVLYSTLILYTTQGLGLEDHFATAFTAGFIALNYTLHILGGYLGGRLMSYRGLFVTGMMLQAIGCLVIANLGLVSLIWGVAIFLVGCGLNAICIHSMLTQLYDPTDKNRELAFLWNYSGMNLGFFLGFTVSGIFQVHRDFLPLFLLASLGSLISFVLTVVNWEHLGDKATAYSQSHNKKTRIATAIAIIGVLILVLSGLLRRAHMANDLIFLAGFVMTCFFIYFAWRGHSKKVWAFLALAVTGTVFWTLYQMAPLGLTLFFDRNVHRDFFGFVIPPQWLQNINTAIIILGGPLMASFIQRLRAKGIKITIPLQFITGLLLIGIGFLILPIGIHFADTEGFSNIVWVISCYGFLSLGELCISPIGYTMVGQLLPEKLQKMGLSTWFLVTGVAAVFSGYFSQAALEGSSQDPLVTNASYGAVFLELGICALIASLFLYFLRKFLHRFIEEKPSLKAVEPAPYNAPQD